MEEMKKLTEKMMTTIALMLEGIVLTAAYFSVPPQPHEWLYAWDGQWFNATRQEGWHDFDK